MQNRLMYLANVVSLQLDVEKCIGCGMCFLVCPHEVFARENGKANIVARDACMECGACANNCPTGAIAVESGVGCAQAVINAALGRSGSDCCCIIEKKEGGSSGQSGCC